MTNTLSLYEKDFYAWTQEQARLIKLKAFNKLDISHLFEEVEDMGNRHADEIESRLTILLTHLLKWKYQPNLQGKSWQFTINEQRRAIAKRLKRMTSLKAKISELFVDAYEDGIFEAEKETGLVTSIFPKKCEWNLKQVLDNNFFPE